MGAWGSGSFQNDDAMDWANELIDGEDDGPLIEALAEVLEAGPDHYLDVDSGNHAVAAAEVIAALGGRAGRRMPKALARWIADRGPDVARELVEKHGDAAVAALARVADGPGSELAELWAGNADWRAGIDELAARLRTLAP